jgi:uncharacterized protein YdhG (YjbR/CyaY superfamily)
VFEDHLRQQPAETQAALAALIEQVVAIVPDAEEGRSYGMPAFRYRSKPLLGFAVHRTHIGVYPFSPDAIASLGDRLEGFGRSKGTVRFSPDHPLPEDVVHDLVRERMREIDAT